VLQHGCGLIIGPKRSPSSAGGWCFSILDDGDERLYSKKLFIIGENKRPQSPFLQGDSWLLPAHRSSAHNPFQHEWKTKQLNGKIFPVHYVDATKQIHLEETGIALIPGVDHYEIV
jgi:hypothetical protein